VSFKRNLERDGADLGNHGARFGGDGQHLSPPFLTQLSDDHAEAFGERLIGPRQRAIAGHQ
jgi:hypothetical protein